MSKSIMELPANLDWRRHAIFLDFDGTLAPIVDRPEDVALAPRTEEALHALQALTDGALAVISGRRLADLQRHLPPGGFALSGSHGVEFGRAGGPEAPDPETPPVLGAAFDVLSRLAAEHGLTFEQKPGAATIHYRSAPDLAETCKAAVDRLARADTGLRAMHGNMVSEVALADVDKGTALARFMAAAPFAGRLPIMAGDDVTDEDAFRAAQDLGGFGIKIGPQETVARVRVDNIDGFLGWLYTITAPPQD